tara:strand:- start:159 stop:1028 length:870 start_codon:yes stop_codon:yes gene_type:complete
MSRPRMPKKYAIDDIRSRFQTVAIDNKYQAHFKPNGDIYDAASQIGIDSRFIDEDLGLYVSDAVLPGSSFADIEIAGDRQGITERVPFSRLYDDVTFTFMVDNEYKVMRFFESWVGLVNPLYGTTTASTSNQVMALNYPRKYKCDMAIAKFNKDYDLTREGGIVLLYQFNEAWPFSVASTPVNYQGANILKLNVTFRYTRYFVYDVTTVGERFGRYGSSDSFNWFLGNKRPYRGSSSGDRNTSDSSDSNSSRTSNTNFFGADQSRPGYENQGWDVWDWLPDDWFNKKKK